MNNIAKNLDLIIDKINKAAKNHNLDPKNVNLIAVSKTIDAQKIEQAIKWGCGVFGENRISESKEKWPALKEKYPNIKLHLIGHLQTNKAKDAVKLFDVIQTLDSYRLASELSKEMKKQEKYPEIFIQINIGEEDQKSGIKPLEADEFIQKSINEYNLPISGLMCIPPANEETSLYFALLLKIAKRNGLKNISMGMSSDYEIAVTLGANFIRVGSAIFGERDVVNELEQLHD